VTIRTALRIVTVSVLVLSLGLHWALLQTVAWTGMLITYTRHASFQEAFTKTFDGQHPCALCKVIKNGRAEEKQQEQQQVKPGFKLDAGLVWQATEFDFACGYDRIPFPDFFGLSQLVQPPKPRPRGVLDDPARV
jgi:hypothetical protein